MSYDPNHFKHAHLDGGQCLDGSGRRWEAHAAAPEPRSLGPVELSLLLRRVDNLAGNVLLTSVAVVLLAIAVVVLCLDRAGWL